MLSSRSTLGSPKVPELAVVNGDDTIMEVAAVMARLRCPRAAVMSGDKMIGVITASRLLQVALARRAVA